MLINKLLKSKLVFLTAAVIGFAPILLSAVPARAQITDGIRYEELETGEPELLEDGTRGDSDYDNDMDYGDSDQEYGDEYSNEDRNSTTPPITSEERLSPTDWINDGEDPAGSDVYE